MEVGHEENVDNLDLLPGVDDIPHGLCRSTWEKEVGVVGCVHSWGSWDTDNKARLQDQDHTQTAAVGVANGSRMDRDVSRVDLDLP